MDNQQSKKRLQNGNIFWKSFKAFVISVNNEQHWKTKIEMTTLANYCTYSVQTIKKFYVTLKGKLGIHIRITMYKIKFWISGCSDITRLKTTRECRFLSIIVDKGTDVSKKEQLLFCL